MPLQKIDYFIVAAMIVPISVAMFLFGMSTTNALIQADMEENELIFCDIPTAIKCGAGELGFELVDNAVVEVKNDRQGNQSSYE